MGGANSDVKPTLQWLFSRVPISNRGGVRKTGSRLALASESSRRLKRVSIQSRRSCPASFDRADYDECRRDAKRRLDRCLSKKDRTLKLSLTADEVNRLIGTSMSDEDVVSCLNRLVYLQRPCATAGSK
jgi:phenylalanyl-tRNA synthetase beta subunit